MPKFPYRLLGTLFNRNFRNDLNQNFVDIESDIKELGSGQLQALEAAGEAETQAIYAQEQGDYANEKGAFASDQGAFAQTQADRASNEADRAAAEADRVAVVADENKTRFLPAVATVADRDSAYPEPVHGDTVRVTGETKTYRFDSGSGWVVTDQYNPTAIDEVNVKLAETANKKTNVFNKKTYGVKENATVLASMANESSDNPRPEVLGFANSQQASTYADRDSVSFYASNRGANPTVSVNSGTIEYTATTVKVTGVSIDLSKVLPGMLIDTFHTPNRFTSIIESIDETTQTITVEDGWYEVKSGGSTTPAIPANGTGFDVNRVTKIWAINNNVYLREEGSVMKAVAQEVGLFATKTGAVADGIDVANFGNKANFGYKSRHSGGDLAAELFEYGFLSESAANGFATNNSSAVRTLLASFVNGNKDKEGFNIGNNGRQSKLRLSVSAFVDNQNEFTANSQKVFILNKSTTQTFSLPTPVGKDGELIFVINVSNVTQTLAIKELDAGFNVNNDTLTTTLNILSNSSSVFVSDNANWVSVLGAFSNGGGYLRDSGGTIKGSLGIEGVLNITNSSPITHNGRNVVNVRVGAVPPQSNADFIGQQYVDSTAKVGYIAVSAGSGAADWKQTTP